MVDRETLDRRLGKLEELLRDLRRLAMVPRSEFLRERGLQAQAERWLQLAAECALDLANHLIADRGWRTPATYKESFQILKEQGVLPERLAGAMEGWAGLRNLLVHFYLGVDHERVFEILVNELGQLEEFAAAVQRAADDER